MRKKETAVSDAGQFAVNCSKHEFLLLPGRVSSQPAHFPLSLCKCPSVRDFHIQTLQRNYNICCDLFGFYLL
jgi:hypothetical protein